MGSGGTAAAANPRHLAIIMDGNGRWAAQRGLPPSGGHKAGVERIRGLLQACKNRHIEVLTLFAFSNENWQRPSTEVKLLMSLFQAYLRREAKRMREQGVSLRVIGRRDRFSPGLQRAIVEAETITAGGTGGNLVIAADYGGQWDISRAARALAEEVATGRRALHTIDERAMAPHMQLADLPPVDLLIRTSGEQRISNFLLWQLAYSELFFTDTLWPDFDERALDAALAAYHCRSRRYGGRSDSAAEMPAPLRQRDQSK